MNISYRWLKTLIDFNMNARELAERLTMIGHAVDELIYLGRGLEQVVVGRAEKIRSHPGADKLKLVTVSYGAELPVEVVCGAPNVKVGGCYPLALEGAELPGGLRIKRTRIRGVESCGMLCSERELGLSDDFSGLMELEPGCTPGTPFARILGRDDWLLVLDITANRGDMWSHLGAARELQPFVGGKVSLPPSQVSENGPGIDELTSVTLEDQVGCPRYMARVIEGVNIGPSPRWLVERLEAVGQRSINNVVDVTNYILFELGQPLHSFDMDKLEEKRIVVRKAQPGEKIVTLDGMVRELGEKMTVIADARKPVALAGIMGDKLTEVDENTKRILLECAYFDPVTIRRTRKAQGINTEASRRFEHGTDIELMPYAVDRASRLIAEVSAGTVVRGTIDAYPQPFAVKEIALRGERARRVLGVGFTEEEVRKWLEGVDFRVKTEGTGIYQVRVPGCRRLDISCEEDLIEELARLWGYERIPVPKRLDVTIDLGSRERYHREWDLRRALAGLGFQEVLTSTFTGSEYVKKLYGGEAFNPLILESPISNEDNILRPALLPTLLACLQRNLNQRRKDIRLFEIGNVFTRRPGQIDTGEEIHLGITVAGDQRPTHWSGPVPLFDFFALKGKLETVFVKLNLPLPEMVGDNHPLMHPGITAAIIHAGEKIGHIGRINPSLALQLEVPEDTCLLELKLEPLISKSVTAAYKEISPFPGSRRDLSILVDEEIPCADLVEVMKHGSPLVVEVTVFDLYSGEHVPKGRKSLAFSILFQSRECTLRDEEIEKAFNKILNALVKKFGAKQR